jgi:hypothetical protein
MTNAIAPDRRGGLDPEVNARTEIDEIRRPVKVVQHPAFRGRPNRTADSRQLVPLRVVSLNPATDGSDHRDIRAWAAYPA